MWDEKRQVLFTAAKDKSLKVWKMPNEWHVYFAKPEEKKEPVVPAAPKPQAPKKEGSDDESDNDDLKGWANN